MISKEVDILLDKGTIEIVIRLKCAYYFQHCYSTKRRLKLIFITNLPNLNEYIEYHRFKQEYISHALE